MVVVFRGRIYRNISVSNLLKGVPCFVYTVDLCLEEDAGRIKIKDDEATVSQIKKY